MKLQLKQIGVNKYQLEKVPGMKAEAVVYVKQEMLGALYRDRSLQQLAQSAMLPRLLSPIVAMPDVHEGYGIPVGGVMVTDGLVSVGGVGMDINCGVRLLYTSLQYEDSLFSGDGLKLLSRAIEREIPVGLGRNRKQELPRIRLRDVIIHGSQHLLKTGYATEQDIEHTEEHGKLKGASWQSLSDKALRRAKNQLGTLGSGNHFIEIQRVAEIFDQPLAQVFGLNQNQICVMVHSGSRALGHQTCLDYNRVFFKKQKKYGIEVPTYNLAALPIETDEGQRYFEAMAGAVNFAFANRQLMSHFIRQVMSRFFEKKVKEKVEVETVYDVAHNIAKWEKHRGKEVLVHRKGATRALPADHEQNPRTYIKTGHPVIVPGSMGTASYVMIGLPQAKDTYYSVNHGAGRTMSRGQAKREINKDRFDKQMKKIIYNRPFQIIKDEAPDAYKDINMVVETLVEAKITKKVARLEPLAVIKGS